VRCYMWLACLVPRRLLLHAADDAVCGALALVIIHLLVIATAVSIISLLAVH
jgi:hypothetical protein